MAPEVTVAEIRRAMGEKCNVFFLEIEGSVPHSATPEYRARMQSKRRIGASIRGSALEPTLASNQRRQGRFAGEVNRGGYIMVRRRQRGTRAAPWLQGMHSAMFSPIATFLVRIGAQLDTSNLK